MTTMLWVQIAIQAVWWVSLLTLVYWIFKLRRLGHLIDQRRQELDATIDRLNETLLRLNAFEPRHPHGLYDVAREVTHEAGLPWTDPRSGETVPPDNKV